MYKYLALLLLLLAACDTYVEDKRSVDFEPIYLPDSEEEDKDIKKVAEIFEVKKSALDNIFGYSNNLGLIIMSKIKNLTGKINAKSR